jgi:hypothetical protein
MEKRNSAEATTDFLRPSPRRKEGKRRSERGGEDYGAAGRPHRLPKTITKEQGGEKRKVGREERRKTREAPETITKEQGGERRKVGREERKTREAQEGAKEGEEEDYGGGLPPPQRPPLTS